nr:ribonuclease H-like domain-containing protein [Tanacetum cinerariifolium]
MLPSYVLDGKYHFELVYGFKPKLSHLRSFVCLCFSFILNNSDKFSARNSDVSEDDFATSMGDNSSSEGNVLSSSFDPIAQRNLPENTCQVQPDVRRSSRSVKMPAKYNDYVVNSSRKKVVRSKWLWKIKYKSTWGIDGYKARLVAKGFNQMEGFEYLETFSPVVKMSIVRCMLNVVIWKLKYFLGIEVLDNKDGICLSQRKYCLELLHEYGLLAAKHVDTPLPKNTTLNYVETNDDHLLVNVGNYQRLVGKLIYLTNTRPDISYDVHCLSQFMHAPLDSHLDVALRVIRYLKGSLESGIQINKNGNLKLRAYANFDWTICPATRKSILSYCVFLGGSLVNWKGKKQSTLSRSSVEAEYRSMTSATCEVIWLSNLLGDMGVKGLLLVVMYYDNSLALQIAANPIFYEKS